MDIKEIAERVSKRIYVEDGLLLSKLISEKFAEALIESYKSELLKEAGEPVLYAEFAEDGGWLGDASEYADHLEEPHALFTSDQVAAAIIKATGPLEEEVERLSKLAYIGEHQFDDCTWKHRHGELRTQLAAAQEEITALKQVPADKREDLRCVVSDLCDQHKELREQLATAEQRVAEACAKVCDTKLGHEIFKTQSECARQIRSGEYRKYMKEV